MHTFNQDNESDFDDRFEVDIFNIIKDRSKDGCIASI